MPEIFYPEKDGYNKSQVDKYIEMLKNEYQKIHKEYNTLLQNYKKLEDDKKVGVNAEIIAKMLVDSEKLAQDIIENAYKEESKIIEQTKKNVEQAYNTLEKAINETYKLLRPYNNDNSNTDTGSGTEFNEDKRCKSLEEINQKFQNKINKINEINEIKAQTLQKTQSAQINYQNEPNPNSTNPLDILNISDTPNTSNTPIIPITSITPIEIKPPHELNPEVQIETNTPVNQHKPAFEHYDKAKQTEYIIPVEYSESTDFTQTSKFVDTETDMDFLRISETAAKMRMIFEQPNISRKKQHKQHKQKKQSSQSEQYQNPAKKKRGAFSVILDIVFYIVVCTIFVVLVSSASNSRNGVPRTFFGYSYFTVLTASMQNEIPQGSLILVKQTEPEKLEIGDNITFMKDATTSVTHKIINIYENYHDSGLMGFQTKGVNNANPDIDIVYGNNIAGKVIFVLPGLGAVISAMRENILYVIILLAAIIGIIILLRGLFKQLIKKEEPKKI